MASCNPVAQFRGNDLVLEQWIWITGEFKHALFSKDILIILQISTVSQSLDTTYTFHRECNVVEAPPIYQEVAVAKRPSIHTPNICRWLTQDCTTDVTNEDEREKEQGIPREIRHLVLNSAIGMQRWW